MGAQKMKVTCHPRDGGAKSQPNSSFSNTNEETTNITPKFSLQQLEGLYLILVVYSPECIPLYIVLINLTFCETQ